ncbi:MAG: LysR family transcriptional regulator [Gammaproteobacteria bacterium]
MDRLTRIKVFVNVVEAGSFSAASGRLGISRAAASKYVSQLEAYLGGRLLNRTTRHVSTTEAGRVYYEQCREILHNLEEADGVVSGLSRQPRGSLRISAPTNFASAHLVPLVSDFMRTYPEVRVELMCTERLVDLVDEGYDLAIRMTNMADPDLIARPLARCRHVLVASPHYLAARPAPVVPEDLQQHACLLYANLEGAAWPFSRDGKDHLVKITSVLTSNNPDVLLEAAIAGMGISLLPSFVVSDAVRSGALHLVLDGYMTIELTMYAVYASRRQLPAKVKLFVDYLRERISDPPYWDHWLNVRL